jgi:hypothetical protein
MATYLRSGSLIDGNRTATHTGLSTSIVIKVDEMTVGAIQELRVTTRRNIEPVREVGFDGFLEKVPNQPTDVTLTVQRVAFDGLRMTEGFGRGFRFIHQQRIPFNIYIYNFANTTTEDDSAVDTTIIHNCWFSEYSWPYTASNYIITENATISAEFISYSPSPNLGVRGGIFTTDSNGYEQLVASQKRRGSLDIQGLLSASKTATV